MSEAIESVWRYHNESKHHFSGYAPSPGFLDWDFQPNPFRHYAGSRRVTLARNASNREITYTDLFSGSAIPAASVNEASLGYFFEHSLALSAWKADNHDSWSLRVNPSSGNLHPTEAYLLIFRTISKQLPAGVYHYSPYFHALEQRTVFDAEIEQYFSSVRPDIFAALGLSSIHWREEWKYGARAFRYCQHDVGHALASAQFAARLLGWTNQVDTDIGDKQLSRLLGLNLIEAPAEKECPDLLLYLSMQKNTSENPNRIKADIDWPFVESRISDWRGKANILSKERAHWPQVAQAEKATEKHDADTASAYLPFIDTGGNSEDLVSSPSASVDASHIIRQRRSAQRMLKSEGTNAQDFFSILYRCLVQPGHPCFDGFTPNPAVHFVIFVHDVDNLEPGLYCLIRNKNDESVLKSAIRKSTFRWIKQAPEKLPLYLLEPNDFRKTASKLSCYQAIAGHSAFSLSMLADMQVMEDEGAWAYRRLYWEAGILGQILYLEAEARRLSGTGIGCYFDDGVHDLLGLEPNGRWQAIYHFTVGKARQDDRLTMRPAYHHLEPGEESAV